MITAFLIGRIILGLYFLNNAYNHLVKHDHMLGYAAAKGVKSPKISIMGTGILLLLGGLSILLGLWTNIGIALLIIFLLGVSFKMHAYWKESDPMAKMSERIAFQKNMAILGALLMMYAISMPWPYAVAW